MKGNFIQVIGALRAVSPKLEEQLQQIPGTTSELLQMSAGLGATKILHRILIILGTTHSVHYSNLSCSRSTKVSHPL